jgi:hypothetical protein
MERRPTRTLNRLRDAWARLFDAKSEVPDVVRAVVARRDGRDLRDLLRVVLGSDTGAADEAAAAIGVYLDRLGPRELVALDEAMRQRYWWAAQPGEREISPGDVPQLRAHGAPVLGLASFHTSGYVRAAAVRELDTTTGGAELPYLLLRLNDWVEPVRDAAYAAIRARLVDGYAPHFIRHLWLLGRLEHCGRADHAALLGIVEAHLVSTDSRPALREALGTPDRWLRRSCYRLLLDSAPEGGAEIVQRALRDEDAMIRLRAIRAADAVLGLDRLHGVLPAASRDPAMPVRREALALWVRYFPDEAEPVLREALFDTHAAVRAVARFDLRRAGFAAFRETYLAALDGLTGSRLKAALFGLGEMGSAEDAARVAGFLSHPAAGVRRAAVVALARLSPEAVLPVFIRALEDPSPGISRAARLALKPRAARVAPAHLWELVGSGEAHVRKNAFILLGGLPKWESIGWMILACGLDDERVVRMARQQVKRWIDRYNHDPSQPSGDQLERMARALDGAALDTERERMLRFLMKGY